MLSEKKSEEAGQGGWGKARKSGLRGKKPHPTFVPPEVRALASRTPGLVITDWGLARKGFCLALGTHWPSRPEQGTLALTTLCFSHNGQCFLYSELIPASGICLCCSHCLECSSSENLGWCLLITQLDVSNLPLGVLPWLPPCVGAPPSHHLALCLLHHLMYLLVSLLPLLAGSWLQSSGFYSFALCASPAPKTALSTC